MQIQKSSEDYLETMLMMQKKHGFIRSIDVAEHLGVTKPSVSYATKRLRENGYITMDKTGLITLEPSGLAIAQEMLDRHRTLTDFLVRLGVDRDTAETAARTHSPGRPTDLPTTLGWIRFPSTCCKISRNIRKVRALMGLTNTIASVKILCRKSGIFRADPIKSAAPPEAEAAGSAAIGKKGRANENGLRNSRLHTSFSADTTPPFILYSIL